MQIVPLREHPIEQLEDVFREEVAYWNDDLCWDYEATLRVVKKFMVSRTLPGFVLRRDDGSVIGYSYFVIDKPVAFIGNLYIRDHDAGSTTYSLLIERTVGAITGSPVVRRVETQVFEFNYEFRSILLSHGFQAKKRFFLVCKLGGWIGSEEVSEPSWYRLTSWQDKFLVPAAEVVYDSYLNSYDAAICRDYQTHRGCVRFLRNLIENPACGQFSPRETLVALDRRDQVCGLLLATRTRKRTGMVPQLSIRRQFQGQGLGTQLLRTYLSKCQRANMELVTLSVSEANAGAFRLYRRNGFEVQKEFHAFIWERGTR